MPNFKNFNISLLGFIILIISISTFLVIRATDEDRWSDWYLGDSQTMLSIKHWNEEGWIKSRFLFIPQGYAKVVYYFDEPELMQHAHGINPRTSTLVSPHLYYTHYPSGYLIPYAFLMKIGFKEIFWFRSLSIIFSITAVILMFILFYKITLSSIAFFASLYYVLSRMFIGYADSLANQPIDDMFRFAFMLFIVFSTRAGTEQKMRLWAVFAWITEFLLSLSSFDSVFFVYVWLIGWDLIENRGFRWRRYLIFALAPIFAHSLQFLQNIWYLGFNDAVNDIIGTFGSRVVIEGVNPLAGIYIAFKGRIESVVPTFYLLLIVFALHVIYFYFKKENRHGIPSILLLCILFTSGFIFFIVLADAGRMRYHARQMLPFVSLLIGTVTVNVFQEFYDFLKLRRIQPILFLYLLTAFFLLFLFWKKDIFHKGWGLNVFNISKEMFNKDVDVSLAKYIRKEVKTRFEPVSFNIEGFSKDAGITYVSGYPQIDPMLEYYANAPILSFQSPLDLAKDLEYLLIRSEYPFSPLIISKDNNKVERILSVLLEKGYIDKQLSFNKYYSIIIVDLTDSLNYEKVKWLGR